MDIIGRIHSIETMGTVDGPGIRYVIFMQGCPMRCIFCHNRDAWDPRGGKEISVEDLVKDIKKYVDFMKFSGGGVTATGGEPVLQAEFVYELFTRVKEMGLNTVMDTSGFVEASKISNLLEVTDLVLLSIKHVNEAMHEKITGVGNQKVFKFIDYLQRMEKRLWIRHVIIPGYTNDQESLRNLAEMLKGYHNIELIDILPYHNMGAYKWESMGLEYPLKDVPLPEKEDIEMAKNIFKEYGFKVNVE